MEHSTLAAQSRLSEFITYPETRRLLAKKLKASSPGIAYEIAAWVWMRELAAYRSIQPGLDRFYFDASGRDAKDFGYLPKLEGLLFERDAVANFQPSERYITGAGLIGRWAGLYGGKSAAIAMIKQCCFQHQRLTDYFPGYGGTQLTADPSSGYAVEHWPPVGMALFKLSQIEAVETAERQALEGLDEAEGIETGKPSEGAVGNAVEAVKDTLPASEGLTGSPKKSHVVNAVSLAAQIIAAKKGISNEDAMQGLMREGIKTYPPKTRFLGVQGFDGFESGRPDCFAGEVSPEDFKALCEREGITIRDLEGLRPEMDFAAYFGNETYAAMWEAVGGGMDEARKARDAANKAVLTDTVERTLEAYASESQPQTLKAHGTEAAKGEDGNYSVANKQPEFSDFFYIQRRRTPWCHPIEAVAKDLFVTLNRMPTVTEVWGKLYELPEGCYGIKKISPSCMVIGARNLYFSDLGEHWKNWTKISPKPKSQDSL